MSALPLSASACFIALLLGACSSVETRSVVSSADLPSSKYRAVVVFAENVGEPEKSVMERIVASALQSAGLRAGTEADLFAGRSLRDREKAQIVQKDFDAVLYVNVAQEGLSEQRLENVTHDGQNIVYQRSFFPGVMFTAASEVTEDTSKYLILKDDGSVYEPIMVLDTNSTLQDTRNNNQVWSARTIATGKPIAMTMAQLFDQVSQQIVTKMRADNLI